jgi:hypothetical protein
MVVRRQIYCRIGLDESSDRVQRYDESTLIWADAVHPASKHQALIVRSIASEKERCVVLLNQDGDMICSMAGCGNRDYVPGMGR